MFYMGINDRLQRVISNIIIVQYFIRSPSQSIRDKHVFFIDITQFFTTLISIFLNSSAKKGSSSSIFTGFLFFHVAFYYRPYVLDRICIRTIRWTV